MDVHPSDFLRKLTRYSPLILLVGIAVACAPTISDLYQRWTRWDESLAHGLLVIGIFICLLYQRLPFATAKLSKLQTLTALLLLILSSLFWALNQLLHIELLASLALPLIYVCALLLIYPLSSIWAQRFLLALPLFALPIWDYLNTPLVKLSSTVVGEAVRLIKMPALIQGNVIDIPYGKIIIADGCSGIRYLVIAMTIGYLIGLLNRSRTRELMGLLAVAIVIGLIANWVRIFILIVIGYESQMQSPLMAEHEYFGWFIFAVIALPAIYFSPVKKQSIAQVSLAEKLPTIKNLLMSLVIMAIAPISYSLLKKPITPHTWQPQLTALAQQHPSWRMGGELPAKLAFNSLGYHEVVTQKTATGQIAIQWDHYQRLSQSDKLVPYIPKLMDHSQWQVMQRETLRDLPADKIVFKHVDQNQYLLQIQWFAIGSYRTTNILKSKLYQIAAIFEPQPAFSIVTLQMTCSTLPCPEHELIALAQQLINIKD